MSGGWWIHLILPDGLKFDYAPVERLTEVQFPCGQDGVPYAARGFVLPGHLLLYQWS
jgi:hypothetical protein